MKKYFYKLAIYPLKLYWFLFRPERYGVKCIIQREDGRILFIKNTYGKGYWNFPGGGIEKGETPEQAIRREVLEETQLRPSAFTKIGDFVSRFEYKKDSVSVFTTKVENPIIKIQESEINSYNWSPINDLPEPLSGVAENCLSLLTPKVM